MALMVRFRADGFSDPGLKRDNNEDRYHSDPDRGVFFVIDGVGGHNAGEKAADTAYNLMRERLERPTGTTDERIREAITVANNEIYNLASTNMEWKGMACVLTVAVVESGSLTVGHVGDSRLYLVENGQIRKVTRDHSPVGEREDRGEISERDAMSHPRRNEVFRDVGSALHSPQDEEFIEVFSERFSPRSAMLLCSDGLSDLVPSAHILSLVEKHAGDPLNAAHALIHAANEAGGKDNVTVVVVYGADFRRSSPQSFNAPVQSPAFTQRQSGSTWGLLLALLLGLAIASGVVAVTKPHWLETENGSTLAWGPVRQPRTVRISSGINDAIAQAQTGDTIIVKAGEYSESIRMKTGVSIVAEEPRGSVLQADGPVVTAEGVHAARLAGFRIAGPAGGPLSLGIRISNSEVEISGNEITGAVTAAIEISGRGGSTLIGNRLSSNPGAAIVVRDAAAPKLLHNVISENGRGSSPAAAAVQIVGTAKPLVIGNSFTSNPGGPLAPDSLLAEIARDNLISAPEPPRPKPSRSGARR